MLWNIIPAAATLAGLALAADLPAIEISGNKFFYSNNGSQFLMKGVAYQQETNGTTTATFVDPLADFDTCLRDIPYLQELQTNVIRVYALDVTKDHTMCMNALADAGIYVIADLSEPGLSINRDSPAWNLELLGRYTSVVDAFQNYSNVLGFFAGNEVTNVVSNTDASAYVKAAVRDTKAYILAKGYRNIPVGYSANDDTDIRVDLAQYFACGDESDHADFFGINMYEWCGDSSFKTSGYETITNQYKDLGIPIFFSEYGCNKVQPRKFTEVQAIYSTEMTDVWSGGIVYLYFQEQNDYGLVSVSGNSVSPLVDFTNLKNQLATISPSFATLLSSVSQLVTTCPTVGLDWSAATVLPPTPDSTVCDCMVDSLSCVVDPSVSSENFGDLFSIVCGLIDCSGVSGNATTGKYGSYSACDAKAQLDFVLNLYYNANGGSKSACDFSGSASLKSATTASSCKAILSSAGVSGTGSVSGSVATQATTTATGKGKGNATSTGTGKGTAETKSGSNSGSSETSSSPDKKSGASKVSTFSSVSAAMILVSCMAVGLGLVFA